MPNELALKAISYGLIWFSLLLLLVALLVSQRKEYNVDKVSRQVFPFTIAMIGLWALIALGVIYTRS
jgi:Zn-dependent protease with chaperone function